MFFPFYIVADCTLDEFDFDDCDSYSSTVADKEIATINPESAANVTDVSWHSKQVNANTPKIKTSTTTAACSSKSLLHMSSQLSAFLESNLPTVEPAKASVKKNVPCITGTAPIHSLTAIEKIFARNVDSVVKQELTLSATNIAIARRDLSTAVNVAVALKREAYLYGSYAYGAPPNNGAINIFFDYGK